MLRINKLTTNMTDENFRAVAATLTLEGLQLELESCLKAIASIITARSEVGKQKKSAFDPLPGHQRLRDQLLAFMAPSINKDMSEAELQSALTTMSIAELEADLMKMQHAMQNIRKKAIQDENDRNLLDAYDELLLRINSSLTQKRQATGIFEPVPDQPAYTALIEAITTYENNDNHDEMMLKNAKEIADIFRDDKSEHSQNALTTTTNILNNNSSKNRDAFLKVIDNNRSMKEKKFMFITSVLLTFLGAAMIAAGIALMLTGAGFSIGFYLAYSASIPLAGGLIGLSLSGSRYFGREESSLVNFGDSMIANAKNTNPNSCTAKIGMFSTTKEARVVDAIDTELVEANQLN